MKKNQMIKISIFAFLMAVFSMESVQCSIFRLPLEMAERRVAKKFGMLGFVAGTVVGYLGVQLQGYTQERSAKFLEKRIFDFNQKLEVVRANRLQQAENKLEFLKTELARELAEQEQWKIDRARLSSSTLPQVPSSLNFEGSLDNAEVPTLELPGSDRE